LVVSTATVDVIFYRGAGLYGAHNIVHELGHLVLGHRLRQPDEDPAGFHRWEETEAEAFAQRVLTHAVTMPAAGDPVPGLGSAFAVHSRRMAPVG
jgi:hypothetical protein